MGKQPWLDGIVLGPGVVRQVSRFFSISRKLCCLNNIKFIAANLGSGLYYCKNKLLGKPKLAAFSLIFFLRRRPEVDEGDTIIEA